MDFSHPVLARILDRYCIDHDLCGQSAFAADLGQPGAGIANFASSYAGGLSHCSDCPDDASLFDRGYESKLYDHQSGAGIFQAATDTPAGAEKCLPAGCNRHKPGVRCDDRRSGCDRNDLFLVPGVGQLIIQGVSNRDFPLVQASILVVSIIYILINFITDLIYLWIDPRIKVQ